MIGLFGGGPRAKGGVLNLSSAGEPPPPQDGVVRVVVLGMGESGMVGYGGWGLDEGGADFPEGYPPNEPGKVLALNNEWEYDDPIVEPVEAQGATSPVFTGMMSAVQHKGWGGLFCWYLWQALGEGYEVLYLPLARGGQARAFWQGAWEWGVASGNGLGFRATVAFTREALKAPNAVIGAILLDQGINDCFAGNEEGWAADWEVIESKLREHLDGTTAPMIVAKQAPTPSTYGNMKGDWSAMLAQYDLFAKNTVPKRIIVQKPDGPWTEVEKIHLRQVANNQLAYDAAQAAISAVQETLALGRPTWTPGVMYGWTDLAKTLSPDCVLLQTHPKMVPAKAGPDLGVNRAIYFLFRVESQSVPSASRVLLSCGQTGIPGSGYIVYVNGEHTSLRFRATDGTEVKYVDHPISPSDVGKVMACVIWTSGSQIGIRVNKVAGATANITTGFVPAPNNIPFQVNSTTPNGKLTYIGVGSCAFLPSAAQMDAWADACKTAKRCVEMPGGTNDHLYNFWTAGEIVADEVGTDNLVANKEGKVRIIEASPTWGF